MLLLKIGSLGPVDQQFNLVSPENSLLCIHIIIFHLNTTLKFIWFNPFFFRIFSSWEKNMEWSYRNIKKIGTHQKQFMRAGVRLKEFLFLKLNTFHARMTFVNTVFPLYPKTAELFIAWKVPVCWSKTARHFCCRRWPKIGCT